MSDKEMIHFTQAGKDNHNLSPEALRFKPSEFAQIGIEYVWEFEGKDTFSGMSSGCLGVNPDSAASAFLHNFRYETMRFGFGKAPAEQLALFEEHYPELYQIKDSILGAAFEVNGFYDPKIMNYAIGHELNAELEVITNDGLSELIDIDQSGELTLPLGLYVASPIYAWPLAE